MERGGVWYEATSVLVGALVAMSACNARRADDAARMGGSSMPAAAGADSVYRLTLRAPSARQPLTGDATELRTAKFVAIEVTTVTNPAALSLAFEVSFQPAGGQSQLLGTVTLFPADNPGRFIIATGGRLRAPGTLTITMVSPDSGSGRDAVQATVRTLSLRND